MSWDVYNQAQSQARLSVNMLSFKRKIQAELKFVNTQFLTFIPDTRVVQNTTFWTS